MTGTTGSELVLVDSSGWLEFLTADTKAEQFRPFLKRGVPLLIPALVLYEVRKVLLLRKNLVVADSFASEAMQHDVAHVDASIALEAASISLKYQLHMSDAIIYTTALQRGARLVTADGDFAKLPGVTVI